MLSAVDPTAAPCRAAFTIATRDRMAAAALLRAEYRKFHPQQRFFIVLADDLGPAKTGDDESIPLGAVALPGPDVFPYQYGLRALCAAVKPFCFRHLLQRADVDQLMYLDADIRVFRRLDEAWEALDRASIVLTPHALRPIADAATPSDRTFLQRGLFNLGFAAIKDTPATGRFVDWWCARVYGDCPAQPARGAYLDQKWLDLAPVYFKGVEVLRDDTCNVAYWNLHERALTASGEDYLVNGRPLGFYHFSGFDPARPEVLSVHQSRYHLSELPALGRLHEAYARALREAAGANANGTSRRPAGLQLGNGVPMSRLASAVVLHCVRNRIAFPAPGTDPGAFCEFITTPNAAVFGADVAPLVTALLDARPDVEAAFPGARQDKHHPGLRDWLVSCAGEEQLETLLHNYGQHLQRDSGLARALAIYRRREDLQAAFPNVFLDPASFERYGHWLDTHGRSEDAADDAVVSGYLSVPERAHRVIQQFFSHPELWDEFRLLYRDETIARLGERIAGTMGRFSSLHADDLMAFEIYAKAHRYELLLACLRYNPRVRDEIGGEPSLLNAGRIESCLDRHGANQALPAVIDALLAGHWITPYNQLRSLLHADQRYPPEQPCTAAQFADLLQPLRTALGTHELQSDPARWDEWSGRALQAGDAPLEPGVNLHGPLRDATGMGEWTRSITRVLASASITHRPLAFPSRFPTPEQLADTPLSDLFGTPHDRLDINLVVANADAVGNVRDWLPAHVLAGRCNIGGWIWETDTLPGRYADAADGLQAIITPSEYSAQAIRNTVDVPVYTVPCALDFDLLSTASPDRAAFALPDDALLFGFFFDAKSVIERKNPGGLIDAFRAAFGARTDVGLVLKVNSPIHGSYEYETLKTRARDLNVIWIERTLSLQDTLHLMASLDVYASLHRSEGFGLTMAEAMALGKPVIATGYSGNLAFMDADSACLVDHALVTTARAYGPYLAGSRWAEPSVEHCAQWMRTLTDRQTHSHFALSGQRRVREMLDAARIAPQMSQILELIRQRWQASNVRRRSGARRSS